jgi:taspase (threonine aspartase 1)
MKYLVENKCTAIEGLTHAISSLEDNGFTNAGLGSNLNANGFVECDASLMNGTDLKWGAVGALQTIKNPIIAAKSVLIEQNKTLPLGLVAPNILVGEGARLWAIDNGCVSANLITG